MSNENYTPFGAEWHKEMKKLPKDVLIELLKKELEKEQAFKDKADKWDALDDQISVLYEDGNTENGLGLIAVGEFAASAFGYL